MKNSCLPAEQRGCQHCGAENSLAYYHEAGALDLYYCEKCYKITAWDGLKTTQTNGEAYPDREKI